MDATLIVGYHNDQPVLALCLIAVVVALGVFTVAALRRSHKRNTLLASEIDADLELE